MEKQNTTRPFQSFTFQKKKTSWKWNWICHSCRSLHTDTQQRQSKLNLNSLPNNKALAKQTYENSYITHPSNGHKTMPSSNPQWDLEQVEWLVFLRPPNQGPHTLYTYHHHREGIWSHSSRRCKHITSRARRCKHITSRATVAAGSWIIGSAGGSSYQSEVSSCGKPIT